MANYYVSVKVGDRRKMSDYYADIIQDLRKQLQEAKEALCQ